MRKVWLAAAISICSMKHNKLCSFLFYSEQRVKNLTNCTLKERCSHLSLIHIHTKEIVSTQKEIAKSNLKILEMRSILLPHKALKGTDKNMAAAQMQANMQRRKQFPFEDNGFKDASVVLPRVWLGYKAVGRMLVTPRISVLGPWHTPSLQLPEQMIQPIAERRGIRRIMQHECEMQHKSAREIAA